MPPPTAPTQRPPRPRRPPEAAEAAAHAAGVLVGEDDSRREDVVRRDHLALADVGLLAQLARVLQRALLHHVAHARAPLDDDEAVRLLDHQADQADRGAELVAREAPRHRVLGLDHGHRARKACHSARDRSRPASRWGRRSPGLAAALALLHVREPLPVRGRRQSQRGHEHPEPQSAARCCHPPAPPVQGHRPSKATSTVHMRRSVAPEAHARRSRRPYRPARRHA